MKPENKNFLFILTTSVSVVLIIGSLYLTLQAQPVKARIELLYDVYMPSIMGVVGGGPTLTPTATSTPVVSTSTPENTSTPTATSSSTPTATQTVEPTVTSTSTPTNTPTNTPTPTQTFTPTVTQTPTSSPTPDGNPPMVDSFGAYPAKILSGQSATLMWQTTGQVTSLTIDQGVGSVLGLSEIDVSPSETTTYQLAATNAVGSVMETVTVEIVDSLPEQIVFDWDDPVTQAWKGFPRYEGAQMEANGDWTTPYNYAEGHLYFRAVVYSQPVPKRMKQQFCIWQEDEDGKLGTENCARTATVDATPLVNPAVSFVTATWQQEIGGSGWYYHQGKILDWTSPRSRYAFVIKRNDGCPVSSFRIPATSVPTCPSYEDETGEWMLPWAGEDPAEWYDLITRFTIVGVPKGGTFSGWHNYPLN